MKTQLFKFFSLIFILLAFSCSDPDDPTDPTSPIPPPGAGNPPPSNVVLANTEDVLIKLPEGAAIDLSKTILSTGMMTFPVSGDGKTKAIVPDTVVRLGYLFDEANNLILMGLLHEGNKEISPETTAQALFYLGIGAYYLPREVVKDFLAPQIELLGYAAFKGKVIEGLKSDILYVENLKYEPELGALLVEYRKEPEVLDIRARQINVDPSGFQSGIQIFEFDGLSLKIANNYRRLAKAFIYKVAYKEKGSKEEISVLSSIGPNEKTSLTLDVEGTKAFSSTLGTIVDQLSGKGIEYGRKESGPIALPLKDNEDEAIYKVRVVGNGFKPTDSPSMTTDEKAAWQKMMLKQFYVDFVLPILSEIFSEVKGIQFEYDIAFNAFEATITQSPAILDLIFSGNFKKASEDFLKFIVVDKGGQELQKQFIERTVKRFKDQNTPSWIDLDRDYNNATASAKYLKIIKAIELTVKLLDMGKLTAELVISDRINEFSARARRTDVKISPREDTVVPFANLQLKAETKTQLSTGQSFFYKWSTTGKYGVIVAAGGLKGPKVETNQATVSFRSEAKASDLAEDNFEKVTVEIYLKDGNNQTLIGDATATINVKKLKLVMKPDDISLDGKKKQTVKLYLERTDYVNDIITIPNTIEYKVEWSTPGKYGKFDGVNNNATTNKNSINYQALDDKVKEGIENITAKVYFRTPDSDWVFREEVKGKVKVINDPKKIILDVAITTKDWNLSDGTKCNLGVNMVVIVPVHPKAVKYSVKTYGFKKSSSWENKPSSWLPGKSPPSTYAFPGATPDQIVGDNYYFTIGRTWGSGPPSSTCGTQIPKWHEAYAEWGGRANIVIEITD